MARQSKKIVKEIPKTDTGPRNTFTTSGGVDYIISQDPMKRRFTLWESVDSGYLKLGTSDGSPQKLYTMIPWDD